MKYFNRKPTVGSLLHEASEPIVSDEERILSVYENHRKMKQDNLGRAFTPFTKSEGIGLAPITKNKK